MAVAVAIAAASVEADASQAVSREVAATAGAVVLAGASAMVAARRFVRVGPMAGEAAASGPFLVGMSVGRSTARRSSSDPVPPGGNPGPNGSAGCGTSGCASVIVGRSALNGALRAYWRRAILQRLVVLGYGKLRHSGIYGGARAASCGRGD